MIKFLLNPSYEIWENCAEIHRGPPFMEWLVAPDLIPRLFDVRITEGHGRTTDPLMTLNVPGPAIRLPITTN